MDITQFYQTFFEEADGLLADMERSLLGLDLGAPDSEHLNAIFRAAHSIKGGAATFGFAALTDTTHLLENLLDRARHGQLRLSMAMMDAFLNTKDELQTQLGEYRQGAEPHAQRVAEICAVLQQLALQAQESDPEPPGAPLPAHRDQAPAAPEPPGAGAWRLHFCGVQEADRQLLGDELAQLGQITAQTTGDDTLTVWLQTACSPEDLRAVCCFVVDEAQLVIGAAGRSSVQVDPDAPGPAPRVPPHGAPVGQAVPDSDTSGAAHASTATLGVSDARLSVPSHPPTPPCGSGAPGGAGQPAKESSIRVDVSKVDQIINLVGELVITQSMLAQTVSLLDPVLHQRLLSGMGHLERNARDLQASVMSIRMMPMDYVFSRFPRLIRDLCTKLGKQVHLVTEGQETELDKSLIERIVDPLTHLVRNCLDHGIESPEQRRRAGKSPEGQLTLSAQHQGGSIVIEVRDDGAGLSRERILAKAQDRGMAVGEAMPDEEVWQLIFAAGFSTADTVTDVSGRGVGMDVVRRNIQELGGHVDIRSERGQGTTIRIVLPLTLAILNGMTVSVGQEVYILPLNDVIESLQPLAEDVRALTADQSVLHVRGEYLALISLSQLFGVKRALTQPTEGIAVIVQAEGERFALLVDQLLGQHQVVVKNLETNYRRVPGISAATILGDGNVALIIDVAACGASRHTP